jgi:hypothetical protein
MNSSLLLSIDNETGFYPSDLLVSYQISLCRTIEKRAKILHENADLGETLRQAPCREEAEHLK